MTYRTLLAQAQKHCDKPYTEYLLQSITNKKVYELYLDNAAVPQDTVDKFNHLLQQEKTGMPIQYLLQKVYFLSYELYIDNRVMIPRFETEELVTLTRKRLAESGQRSAVKSILDIGTGSGAIAIALADIFPKASIAATDISADALEVAKINISKYNFQDRIDLYQADLFPNLKNTRFDLIISNPPYIPEDEIEKLSPPVKDYEPHLALNGGKQGFEIIERIINQAPNYLAPNGFLALEVDPRHTNLIRAVIPSAEFEKDNQGMIRYAFINF